MEDALLTWAVRTFHVASAAFWIGGYAVMALLIVPALVRRPSDDLRRLALATARLLSIAGTMTILTGAVMITRSRGYGMLFRGEWGGIVLTAFVLAVLMMAIGDGGLRRALLGTAKDASTARRWAIAGLMLGVLAITVMTRAIYAR
ncbi:MAG: hypothetical protein NTZ05_23200 [Chloroflexi bacterium]|nr:hypothetical protein [Chloroflexota bacterium]